MRILVAVALLLLFFPVERTYAKSHVVKSGDTLYAIATRHRVSVREIKRINRLSSARIHPGTRLKVPASAYRPPAAVKHARAAAPAPRNLAPRREPPHIAPVAAERGNRLSRLIDTALAGLGMPYRFGGNGEAGIDCSAYVRRVFAVFNIALPRNAAGQFEVGSRVKKDELEVGDLVFFQTYAKYPSHVGIYLGENQFIHASSIYKHVTINRLDEPYYDKRYIGAKRLLIES